MPNVSVVFATIPNGQQFFAANGEINYSGNIYTYLASTLTPSNTYTSNTGGTLNPNPIPINNDGYLTNEIWIPEGTALRVRIVDGANNLLQDIDQIPGVNDLSSVTDYSFAGYLSANSSGVVTFAIPQTPVEQSLGIIPSNNLYVEGDIRRYGANTANTDNSTAFNTAHQVSGGGGSPVYVPPGQWNITTSIKPNLNSSMYGAGGNQSLIYASGCHGIEMSNTAGNPGGAYSVNSTSRFFRDFAISGNNDTTSNSSGIYISMPATYGTISGATFSGISIKSFQNGIYARGLAYCQFFNVSVINCFTAHNFNGQSVVVQLISCNAFNVGAANGSMSGNGSSTGISINSVAGETCQDLAVISSDYYGFQYGASIGLAFDIQFENAQFSYCQNVGVQIISSIGGIWVSQCWIELSGLSAGQIGVDLTNISEPSTESNLHIVGNTIVCDNPYAGSQGVYVGQYQLGVTVADNTIWGFDKGVYVSALAHSAAVRDNRINILPGNTTTSVYSSASYAIEVHNDAFNATIGPNEILNGSTPFIAPAYYQAATATSGSSSLAVNVSSSVFPANTPVQFDQNGQGFYSGVTYYVASVVDATHITLSANVTGPQILANGSGAVGNVYSAPLSMTLGGSGRTAPGLSFFANGAFMGSISDPASNGVCNWAASGKLVYVDPGSLGGSAASSTAMVFNGLPPYLAPPVTNQGFIVGIQNNSANSYGYGAVTTIGTVNLYTSPGFGAWTASGNKGIWPTGWVWSYL